MKLITAFLLMVNICSAADGLDLLIKKDGKLLTPTVIQQQKQLVLDDHFLVQFYGQFMSLDGKDSSFMQWSNSFLDKDFLSAFEKSFKLNINSKEQEKLVHATRLYLLWKLNLKQTFVNEWIALSVKSNFLNTPLGIALDQIIGNNASEWILANGIYLSPTQRIELNKISQNNTRFNVSLQSFLHLRQGEKALEFVGKLSIEDPLRLKLADTVMLAYARSGELAKSAKVLKEIYEPVLKNEKDINKISSYYLTLARMLYQAQAFEAAEYYYELIPDESDKFLTARVEKMWISMHRNDLAKIRGDVHTLSKSFLADQFMPEVYLVSSMANLKLCQFKAVEKNFNDFVMRNKKFIQAISKNLNSNTPLIIDKNDFFIANLMKAKATLVAEKKQISEMNSNQMLEKNTYLMDENFKFVASDIQRETKRKWQNREKLLSSTIKKMRFVKVEFLSTMRRLNGQLAKMQSKDELHLQSSGLDKSDRLVFPYDGVTFGDELFHYQSKLQNLCLKGKQ